MEQKKNNSQLHIFFGILLLVAGLFVAPHSGKEVRAQADVSQSSASEVRLLAQGGSCGTVCGAGYGACGAAPAGYNVTCQQGRNTTTGTCVCSPISNNPDDTNAPNVPNNPNVPSPTSGKLPPLTQECTLRCDLNQDGAITKDDFRNETDPARINWCTQNCPWADGSNPDPIPSTDPQNPNPSGLLGDCAGSANGGPDGKVDLKDVEQYRKELNDEVQTLACDFDQSGDVDIIDFTNYLRPGFVKYNKGGNGDQDPNPSQPVPTGDPDNGNIPTPEGPTPVPPQQPDDGAVITPAPDARSSQP